MSVRSELQALSERVSKCGRTLRFMEVCGTHTMAAARSGIRQGLAPGLRLISGPGCPVCVSPVEYVDHALALARKSEVVIATFGDLMRVPGSQIEADDREPPTLQRERAMGAAVEVVYSPLEALALAKKNPSKHIVFLGVGFETTAPILAASILQARDARLGNYSLLSAVKTIPEAMELLAKSEETKLDGFLCPGHVSVILGTEPYRPIAERLGRPCAIGGFEPQEILRALDSLVDQVEKGEARVDNCYPGPVRKEGNPKARAVMYEVFEPCDSAWRGLGVIGRSGLKIKEELRDFDAAARFELELPESKEPAGCRCGDVLKGVIDPKECGLFARACTPENPKGACMVSSEGSCAASYQYARGD